MANWMAQLFTYQFSQFYHRVWAVIYFLRSAKTTWKSWWLWQKKTLIFGGDFNLIFDCNFDASGGNPILKKKSLVKLLEIKEALYLCDICRIRNPNVRRFTFWKNHVSSFIEQRLDFFVISNILKESIIKLTFLLLFVPIIRRYFSLYN